MDIQEYKLCSLKKGEFIKMHGAGNNFIIVSFLEEQMQVLENRDQHTQDKQKKINQQLSKLAVKLCNPNFSIGADGLLAILYSSPYNEKNIPQNSQSLQVKYHMRIVNKDGSLANMCGNGLRCFAACLHSLNLPCSSISTDSGLKQVQIHRESLTLLSVKIRISLYPTLSALSPMLDHFHSLFPAPLVPQQSPYPKIFDCQFLNLNIPHYVIFLQKIPQQAKIVEMGKIIQASMDTNVNFVQKQRDGLYLRTYERGAGLTLACGTGACASAVAYMWGRDREKQRGKENSEQGLKQSITDKVKVRTEGGVLTISRENGGVLMEGPAQFICHGFYY